MVSPKLDSDAFLDSTIVDGDDFSHLISIETDESDKVFEIWSEPEYTGKVDYRLRQLSHSSRQLLSLCKRKFQLQRLRANRTQDSPETGVTFAFGHIVGEAVQGIFAGLEEQEILWKMFLMWDAADLFSENEREGKSFWEGIMAYQKLRALKDQGFLDEYEIVWYNGKPACELSFCINFPDGFRYRGHVDAVLRHKITGQILVLEAKTTKNNPVNPASYKNSGQAIGYSIVLDHLFPDLSSYEVLYLVYQTKIRNFEPIPFKKTYLQRALWIRELLLDIDIIKLCDEADVFPMNGDACTSFGRDCEYLQTCTLSTKYLTKPCTQESEDKVDYQVTIGLMDLLETQLEKVGE